MTLFFNIFILSTAYAEEPVKTSEQLVIAPPLGSAAAMDSEGFVMTTPPQIVDALALKTNAEAVKLGAEAAEIEAKTEQRRKERNNLFGGALSYSTPDGSIFEVDLEQTRKGKLEVIASANLAGAGIHVEQTRADTQSKLIDELAEANLLDKVEVVLNADGSVALGKKSGPIEAWTNGGYGNGMLGIYPPAALGDVLGSRAAMNGGYNSLSLFTGDGAEDESSANQGEEGPATKDRRSTSRPNPAKTDDQAEREFGEVE